MASRGEADSAVEEAPAEPETSEVPGYAAAAETVLAAGLEEQDDLEEASSADDEAEAEPSRGART